MIGAKVMSLHC